MGIISFIFGRSDKKRKKDSETFGNAFDELKTKTLGGIITSIRKSFDIDTDVNFLLSLFIDMRNQFIHGITYTERYDIEDNWGQRELLNLLRFRKNRKNIFCFF